MSTQDRAQSRGREPAAYASSGRGGAGNIQERSASRDLYGAERGASLPRGREMNSSQAAPGIMSTGRGGAGNIRSPSRDALSQERKVEQDQFEADVLARASVDDPSLVHSTGRGGAGNIIGDRSRSRSRARQGDGGVGTGIHSVGRGGAGNMAFGDKNIAEREEEKERRNLEREHPHAPGIHSTGRGGLANMTSQDVPPAEPLHAPAIDELRSSGRGGAGNIRQASRSRERGG